VKGYKVLSQSEFCSRSEAFEWPLWLGFKKVHFSLQWCHHPKTPAVQLKALLCSFTTRWWWSRHDGTNP